MPEQTISYRMPTGESSDTANRDSYELFEQIVGFTPFLPDEDGNGGLEAIPGWTINGDSPFVFYPGISFENEDPNGSPSTTPEESAYYRKLVRRTAVHPDLTGTIVMTVYSSNGDDAETGRFPSIYQELWGSQIESSSGAQSNTTLPGSVY